MDVASINTSASGLKLMDVSTYPTATFTIMHPISLAGVSADGIVHHFTATGTLTVHGTTTALMITLSDERLGSALYVLADIPITFVDWHIAVPYGVASDGTIEVLLDLTQGAGSRV